MAVQETGVWRWNTALEGLACISAATARLSAVKRHTASRGPVLDFIASPGESFSEEGARWWKGHVLGTTSNASRAIVKSIRSESKADLTATQVAARSRGFLSTEEVEAADRGIEGQREGTRRAAENREAKAAAQGGPTKAAKRAKRHREAANQQGPCGCPLCFKTFGSRDGRNKHVRRGTCCVDEVKHAAAMEQLGLGGGKGSGQMGKPKGPRNSSSKKGQKNGSTRAR